MYKLMIGSVVPRPIGWISTVSDAGDHNLAPFSFFNAVCSSPPHVQFCATRRGDVRLEKDTIRNIRETGEFVVNVVTEATAEAMNITATEFPADVDEFAVAGLTPAPSLHVRPARVAESPIHFECKLAQIVEVGDPIGGSSLVIGQVVHMHVDDDVLLGNDKIDIARLQPVARLGGNWYCRITDVFELIRPPSQLIRR